MWWAEKETQSLTVVYLPLIIAVITGASAFLLYWWQKSVDRQNALLAERRKLYRDFISATRGLDAELNLYGPSKEAAQKYRAFRELVAELAVTAPDNVYVAVLRYAETLRWYASKHGDSLALKENNIVALTAKEWRCAVFEMRKDTFGKTALNADDLAVGAQVRSELEAKRNSDLEVAK